MLVEKSGGKGMRMRVHRQEVGTEMGAYKRFYSQYMAIYNKAVVSISLGSIDRSR